MVKKYKIVKYLNGDSFFEKEYVTKDIIFTIHKRNKEFKQSWTWVGDFPEDTFQGTLRCDKPFKMDGRMYYPEEDFHIFACILEEVNLNPQDWV